MAHNEQADSCLDDELKRLQIEALKFDCSKKESEHRIKMKDLKYKLVGTACTVLAIAFGGWQIRILNRQMDNNEKASQQLQARDLELRSIDKAHRRNELLAKLYSFDDAIHKDLLTADPIVTKLLFHDDSGKLYRTIRRQYNEASHFPLLAIPGNAVPQPSQTPNAVSFARMYSYSCRFGDMFEFFLMLSLDENNPIEKTLKVSWDRCIEDKCKESYGFVHCMYESRNGWSEDLVKTYFQKHFERLSQEDKDMVDKKGK